MKIRLLRVAAVCALVATMGSVQAAGNIEAGKKKAASCNTCHGEDGVGINPTPPLAGLTEEYFTRQMNAYKTGKRENAMMEACRCRCGRTAISAGFRQARATSSEISRPARERPPRAGHRVVTVVTASMGGAIR